jgi:hypothetical protein
MIDYTVTACLANTLQNTAGMVYISTLQSKTAMTQFTIGRHSSQSNPISY